MGTGRDDFTRDTIRKAAGRVGYRCSYPGCKSATIGASMESPDKTSVTGVAAHICAAAEGGPRYDKHMTVEERRGIENCLWLCQTHSKLIDTDEKTYTVEILRKWKNDAEAAASAALANGDYFSEYYNANGDNLGVLTQLFDDMIIDGQYQQLSTMLSQYKSTLSEKYEEFILRYQILYDVYCNRSQLDKHLDTYCRLVCKSGVDILIGVFLSFHLIEELRELIVFCSSDSLKTYANLALSNGLIQELTAPVGSQKTTSIPDEHKETILNYITNYIAQNRIIGAIDVTGAEYHISSDEFYYKAVRAAYNLSSAMIYGRGFFDGIASGADFSFIQNNLHKIKLLDISLQQYIWEQLLDFLSEHPEQFDIVYEQCPVSLRTSSQIKRLQMICQINRDVHSVNRDVLLELASKSGGDSLLFIYLNKIEKSDAKEFLDEHRYLYKQNSIYLRLALELQPNIQPEEGYGFLKPFSSIYSNDFSYHLLLAEYPASDQQRFDELDWLKKHYTEMKHHDIIIYLSILRKNQCWDELADLSKLHLPNECLFRISCYLSASKNNRHLRLCQELLQKLIDLEWKRKGLHYQLGNIQRAKGSFENAKDSFQNEYDEYEDSGALVALIQLRYKTNEYLTDYYFDQLKKDVDANSQNLVAAVYMKRNNYAEARKYFLRSLLLKANDNPSINGFFQASSHLASEEVQKIGENVFCVIKNNSHTQHIAIHATDIMEDILSPSSFADYTHYSVQDRRISFLLFAEQGDSVTFDGETYEVQTVEAANKVISRFFFSSLSNREGVQVISASNPEELREQLCAVLGKSSEALSQQIDIYNQLEVRPSLALFSNATGKGMLKTCEFLAFENKEKIRNNLIPVKQTGTPPVFVLAYDTIVYLAHLGLDELAFAEMKLVCPLRIKNQLLNDIGEELADLSDNNQKGTMYYCDGKITIMERTLDARQSRYAFLIRLKAFVESLQTVKGASVFVSCNKEMKAELETLFTEEGLYCEQAVLGTVQCTENSVLVTDDQFMYMIANTEGMATTGITGLLAQSNLNWKSLLSISKKLRSMNYTNYIPIDLYQHMVDQLLDVESEPESAVIEILEWIKTDTDSEPTQHHEDLTIQLFRDVIDGELDYLNPENILFKIAIGILERRNPGFIQKCITDAMMSLFTVEDNPDLYVEESQSACVSASKTLPNEGEATDHENAQ